MKKSLKVLSALTLVLCLTGCGKETLTCTMTQNQPGVMTMDMEVEALFNNNEVTNMEIDIDANIEEAYRSNITAIKDSINTQYENYRKNGAEVNVTNDEDSVNAEIKMDLSKMTDKQKKALEVTDVYGTKEATKKDLEKQGYTCK